MAVLYSVGESLVKLITCGIISLCLEVYSLGTRPLNTDGLVPRLEDIQQIELHSVHVVCMDPPLQTIVAMELH